MSISINEIKSCNTCIYKSYLFNHLSPEELSYINQNKKEVKIEKGELIIQEGNPINKFLYLVDGLVKLHKTGLDNKEHIISIARPRDFVGLLTLFSGDIHKYSMTAIETSYLCITDFSAIKKVLDSNSKFANGFLEKMSNAANLVILNRFEISNKNLRGRIAWVLLNFANEIYQNDNFDLPITRKEVGQMIDMTTENVIRIFSEFRKDGILEITGRRMHIKDKEMLRKIAISG